MATLPDVLSPTMENLLACANGALIEADVPVGKAFLNPGLEIPWDNCCEDQGQLWVRVLQMYPSRSFPAPDQTAASCNPMFWTAQLGVGTLRCAHTVNDHNEFPTQCEMTSDALQMTRDAALLETAIRCCWAPPMEKFLIERWVPLSTEGGCMGGEWTVFVALPSCSCPSDPPAPVPVEC
jgi:hypothetical protein